jgi:hypothetical protein
MCIQTIIVCMALYFDTRYMRVAFISFITGTYWLVVDHPAEGMAATCTRVLADLVEAGRCFSTLVICRAS